jgi:HPt (histidine-containing phosphotransfer) domain-containing protein
MSSHQANEFQEIVPAAAKAPGEMPTPMAAAPAAVPVKSDPMRAILAVVGLAIMLFLAFSSYSIYNANLGSTQLAQIKSLYFPVLERIDISVVQLDKMEEQYMLSVMTGERDPLDQAAEHFGKADEALSEVVKLYPARGGEAADLEARLAKYKQQADSTATALLDKTATDVTGAGAAMSKTLADLRTDIKAFRKSSYDEFVRALESTQQVARLNLILGISAGLMNLGFMGVLVYFIRNNVRMMLVIAEQNATLEQRVAERTAQLTQKTNDIAAMLQNMSLGVCTVVSGNRVHPEYSAYLRLITGVQDLADQPLLSTVFGRSDLGENSLDQISVALSSIVGEDAMMFDFNSHLLPTEIQLQGNDNKPSIVQLHWSPIAGAGNVVEKVLLIVQDVTHLRELEIEASAQRAQMDTIARILKVPVGKFNDFMASARELSDGCRALIQGAGRRDDAIIAHLFRNMHTIKGNARTFDFSGITDVAHAAEQAYDQLRKDADALWEPERLLADLDAVDAGLANYRHVNDDTLGRKGRSGDLVSGRGTFLGIEQIVELKAAVAAFTAHSGKPASDRLRGLVEGLGLASLERVVSGAMDAAESLANELGKPTPALALSGGEIGFNPAFAEALKSSLMHIVRNSLDHGIEAPADRQLAGKDPRGQLRIDGSRQGEGVQLRIRDDGRGLALQLLLDKGRAAALIDDHIEPTRQEIAELIFHAGLSTSAAVTQVSGRGVGMDAVRAFLREQGAEVCIELDAGSSGRGGFAPFTFVIQVPASACRV